MLSLLSWTSLVLFSVVVSQPLFYALALGTAARRLGPSAYVELRQQINAAIATRLTGLYTGTLVSLLALLASAVLERHWPLTLGAGVAAAGLIADGILATKLNVPINKRIDAWSAADVPDDWQVQRERWDAAFALRRVVLLSAFAALTLGLIVERGCLG